MDSGFYYIEKLSRILRYDSFVKWLTPDRLKLYPPHIPVLMLIAWSISLFLGSGLTDISGTIVGSDFIAFFTAGKLYLSHNLQHLYDLPTQYLFQKSIVAPIFYKGFTPYINPPFAVPFFAIFSHSSYLSGLLLWWLFGLLMVLLVIFLLRRDLDLLKHFSMIRLSYYSLLFPPSLIWFIFGQNTAVSLVLYALFLVYFRRSRDFLAGIFLGLLLFKPQLCLAPGLVVLLNRRWKTIAGALITGCFWVSAITPFIGFKPLLDYVRVLPYLSDIIRLRPNIDSLHYAFGITTANIDYHTWGVISVFGFWSLLVDALSTRVSDMLYLFTLAAGIAYLYKAWRKAEWQPGTRSWDLRMAGSLTLGLVLTPHLFSYDLMLLVLPIALVWNHYPSSKTDRPLDGGLILFWTALLYLGSFLGPYITLGQLKLISFLGFPAFAFQVGTIVMIAWSLVVMGVAVEGLGSVAGRQSSRRA